MASATAARENQVAAYSLCPKGVIGLIVLT